MAIPPCLAKLRRLGPSAPSTDSSRDDSGPQASASQAGPRSTLARTIMNMNGAAGAAVPGRDPGAERA